MDSRREGPRSTYLGVLWIQFGQNLVKLVNSWGIYEILDSIDISNGCRYSIELLNFEDAWYKEVQISYLDLDTSYQTLD